MFGQRLKAILISCFIVSLCLASTSTDAEKAYRAGDFTSAEALYAKLLKSSPSNRIYNHRYGVCLYEQGKDYDIAEKHLLKSKKQGVSLSYFYLGRVCFLQYKFDDAIAYYNAYLKKASDKEKKALVDAQIPKCEQGQEMLQRAEDVKVIDRVVVNKTEFYNHYKLSQELGTYLSDPSLIGESMVYDSTSIYQTERADRVFFSMPDDQGHGDLVTKNRLLDQWSEKSRLDNNVNTDSAEAYPFLMPDGIMLYFSSKGHDALGGYDIFVTRYNATNDAYLPPRQLGMPFNSLGNDILFTIDEYNNLGWFASDRDTEDDKIAIYTFIPNVGIKMLDVSDEEELRKLALLSDYSSFENALDTTEAASDEVAPTVIVVDDHPIYFILNDTLIYSSLNDFMSEEARETYILHEGKVNSLDSIKGQLEEKRRLYSKTTDSYTKSELIADIMQLEEANIEGEEQEGRLLLSARRLELETLDVNGGYLKPKPKSVEAPVEELDLPTEHLAAWESEIPGKDVELVDEPFFYEQTLYAYYDQVYSPEAISHLIEANKMKTEASNKQFFADYIMREFSKPQPEEGFFEKIFSYDTTMTPNISEIDMISKVNILSNEASLLFLEASYLNYYTLEDQNLLLLESVNNDDYREQLSGLMRRADLSLQKADQQDMSHGNNQLKDAIQFLEATTLTYLKYRYDKPKELVVEKQFPTPSLDDTVSVQDSVVMPLSPSEPEIMEEVIEEVPVVVAITEEFRIQIGIYSRMLSDQEILQLPDMSYEVFENGKSLYRYFTGCYEMRSDAEEALLTVKEKGYKDAFVVRFEDGKFVE